MLRRRIVPIAALLLVACTGSGSPEPTGPRELAFVDPRGDVEPLRQLRGPADFVDIRSGRIDVRGDELVVLVQMQRDITFPPRGRPQAELAIIVSLYRSEEETGIIGAVWKRGTNGFTVLVCPQREHCVDEAPDGSARLQGRAVRIAVPFTDLPDTFERSGFGVRVFAELNDISDHSEKWSDAHPEEGGGSMFCCTPRV